MANPVNHGPIIIPPSGAGGGASSFDVDTILTAEVDVPGYTEAMDIVITDVDGNVVTS